MCCLDGCKCFWVYDVVSGSRLKFALESSVVAQALAASIWTVCWKSTDLANRISRNHTSIDVVSFKSVYKQVPRLVQEKVALEFWTIFPKLWKDWDGFTHKAYRKYGNREIKSWSFRTTNPWFWWIWDKFTNKFQKERINKEVQRRIIRRRHTWWQSLCKLRYRFQTG